jgi:hypothetical protein
MTPGGTILGSYFMGDLFAGTLVHHGFLRTADGNFTPFDPPNSVGTTPTSINDSGIITGFFNDDSTQDSERHCSGSWCLDL